MKWFGRIGIAAAVATGMAMGPALAQDKPPVRIGHIAIMSGPASSYGKLQKIMVDLAVEDVNAKGGVNGSKLVVETVDSQLDPGQAVLLYRKLANDGAFATIGPMTGTQWETIAPLASKVQLPAITVNASKPGITRRPWTLRLVPADDTLIPQGVEAFLKMYPNVRRVAIVADVREASGKAGAEEFRALIKKHNLELADMVEFSTRATDLSPVAIRVTGLKPDAVFIVALGPSALLLAKELETQAFTNPILGNSIIWPGNFVNNVGKAGRNWHTIGFATNDEVNGDQELYKNVSKRYVAAANDPALGVPANVSNNTVAYDAVMLLADIMRRNKIDGSTDVKKARETIRDELANLKSFRALQEYKIRDTGDGDIPARILVPDIEAQVWRFAK